MTEFELKIEISNLYSGIYDYNHELLEKSNKNSYCPSYKEVFDFYISSNALSLLKNMYYEFFETKGTAFNCRCIIEGLALLTAIENNNISIKNMKLLESQSYLIEYNEYSSFRDLFTTAFNIDPFKQDYDKACEIYNEILKDESESRRNKIISSAIPFVCNPRLNYKKIIIDNLGKKYAEIYSYLSVMIHPCAKDNKTIEENGIATGIAYDLIKNHFKNLKPSSNTLIYYSLLWQTSPESNNFCNLITEECNSLNKIETIFIKEHGMNYVSDIIRDILLLLSDIKIDILIGLVEQTKIKWKPLIENIALLYELYFMNDNAHQYYKIVQLHRVASIMKTANLDEEVDKTLNMAYEIYKERYPQGIEKEIFNQKFLSLTGYTIDGTGNIKSLMKMVDQLCKKFDKGELLTNGDSTKMNYIESQIMSHANGYLWFCNIGAWKDVYNIFTDLNFILSNICLWMSEEYKAMYKSEKDYKYRKIYKTLHDAGKIINDNTSKIIDSLAQRTLKI